MASARTTMATAACPAKNRGGGAMECGGNGGDGHHGEAEEPGFIHARAEAEWGPVEEASHGGNDTATGAGGRRTGAGGGDGLGRRGDALSDR